MKSVRATVRTLAVTTLLLGAPAPALCATFAGLGDLPGGVFSSTPIAISADGSTATGWSWSATGREAFRWTRAGGIEGLGDLGIGGFGSSANGASADGAIVVGTGSDGGSSEAFRWTSESEMVGLGKIGQYCEPLGYCFHDSTAVAASSDGAVLVGMTSTPTAASVPYRWTAASGMVELPVNALNVRDVSGDGQVSIGLFDNLLGYRYSETEGLVLIDATGVGATGNASVEAISHDGSKIVGLVYFTPTAPTKFEAIRWTETGGFELLGVLGPPGEAYSDALAASGDGSVVVGVARGADRAQAFLWTSEMGIRSLEEFLTQDHGLDLAGWELWRAVDVSEDGATILGYGVNPDGQGEAWIATLSEPVPASPLLGLRLLAVLLLFAGSRGALHRRVDRRRTRAGQSSSTARCA